MIDPVVWKLRRNSRKKIRYSVKRDMQDFKSKEGNGGRGARAVVVLQGRGLQGIDHVDFLALSLGLGEAIDQS